MIYVALTCLLLLVLTTAVHYEALQAMSAGLPRLRLRSREKLVLVIGGNFLAHVVEIALYAVAYYLMVHVAQLGDIGHPQSFHAVDALYFSAETFSSLGYGDYIPSGPVRLLAGAEALNGLLLIGWSASYCYVSMDNFWREDAK